MNTTRRIAGTLRQPGSPGRLLLIDLALVAAILLIYAQTLGFGFAKVDDTFYVTNNPHVLGGLNAANAAWAFRSFENSNWHPLTWISLMADATIGGGKPWAFHATNVAFHAANALLLFHLLFATTRSAMKSAFVAALFAIHPLHVESVAWVTERKDVLSTFFWLLAIAAHVYYSKQPSARRYAAVVAAFALGAISKPMVVTLPLTLLLFDAWPLDRLSKPSSGASRGFTPVIEKLPLLVLSAASCAVTLVAQASVAASLSTLPFATRLGVAVVAYVTYVGKMLWPAGLAIHFVFENPIAPWKIAACALALTVATWLAVRLRARHRYLTFGWLFYLVTLVPVIGLVQVGAQSIADRYTYVPLIGLFVVVAWGAPEVIAALVPRLASKRGALAAVAGLVLASLAVRAHDQAKVWRDAFTLFEHAVAVNGNSALSRMGLGQELAARGRDADAIDQYRAALRLNPAAMFARQHLAESLERAGKLEEASTEFREMLALDPGNAEAGLGLGVLLIERGRSGEAVTVLERALSASAADARIRAVLGLALTRLEQLGKAEAAFEEALRIDPENVLAHNGIAVVLGRTGRTKDAIAHLRRVLATDPNQPEARANLARLLLREGTSD